MTSGGWFIRPRIGESGAGTRWRAGWRIWRLEGEQKRDTEEHRDTQRSRRRPSRREHYAGLCASSM